jgi:hypothetical protein
VEPEAVPIDHLDERGQTIIVERALAGLCFVEVADVDNPIQLGIQLGDCTHRGRHKLTEATVGRMMSHGSPIVFSGNEEPGIWGATRPERILVILANDIPSDLLVLECPHLLGEAVVEHVREPLEEDQREDEILELGSISRATNRAGRVPEPRFEGSRVQVLVGVLNSRTGRLRPALRSGVSAVTPPFPCHPFSHGSCSHVSRDHPPVEDARQ